MMACTRRRDCASWTHYPECPAKYSGAGVLLSDPPPDFSDGSETVVMPAKERIVLHETVYENDPTFLGDVRPTHVYPFGGGRSVPSTRATLADKITLEHGEDGHMTFKMTSDTETLEQVVWRLWEGNLITQETWQSLNDMLGFPA